MKAAVFWLILALSLLFNVFFAAGYMQARAQAERAKVAASVVRAVANELELNPSQEALFGSLQSALRDEETAFGDALALARQELRQELERPAPDVARVGALASRYDELMQQRQAARAVRFREFVEALSPEQCHRLSRRLHKGQDGPPRRGAARRSKP